MKIKKEKLLGLGFGLTIGTIKNKLQKEMWFNIYLGKNLYRIGFMKRR